jgi:o-succinylbenzoate---CoA ligase
MEKIIDYQILHPNFKFNAVPFNKSDLKQLAYCFIKEGNLYQNQAGNFILDWLDGTDFIKSKTSGTTGTPKTISIPKKAMLQSAMATAAFFDLKATDKVLHCLPTQFIAGKMMFVRAFVLGFDLYFEEPSSNPLKNNKTIFDFAAMVPLQVENSIHELQNIKKLIVGGAKIHSKLEKKLLHLQTEIFETYGMTETITHIAAKKVGQKAFSLLPNISIHTNENNCLIINAPLLYPDGIVTNDVVELISETQFIFIGRFDNVINSAGVKLFPEQIEAKLIDKINHRFYIVGSPDEKLGQKVVLYIECEKYHLEDTIFNNLDKFEKPKEIIFVPKFNETPTGKIIRKDFF